MQIARYVVQEPGARMNWQNDWADFLGENDSITARQWTIRPLNNTTPETPALTGDTTAIVFVEGLIGGKVYHLVEHITTLNGVQEEQTIVIRAI